MRECQSCCLLRKKWDFRSPAALLLLIHKWNARIDTRAKIASSPARRGRRTAMRLAGTKQWDARRCSLTLADRLPASKMKAGRNDQQLRCHKRHARRAGITLVRLSRISKVLSTNAAKDIEYRWPGVIVSLLNRSGWISSTPCYVAAVYGVGKIDLTASTLNAVARPGRWTAGLDWCFTRASDSTFEFRTDEYAPPHQAPHLGGNGSFL